MLNFTELRQLQFAESMYRIIFPHHPEPTSQTAYLYEFLWKKIVDQQLRPGDRVVDTALAEEAGVSRTPVREAMQRLVQDGLLEQMPRGVRVAIFTNDAIAGFYDYRAALETFSARRSAGRVPSDEVQRLSAEGETLLTRLGAPGGEHDPALKLAFMRHDLALHQAILRYGGNAYIAQAMAAIHARLSIFQVAGTRIPGRMAKSEREHGAILRTLAAGDADGAGAAMEAHIEAVKQFVLASVLAPATPVPLPPGNRRRPPAVSRCETARSMEVAGSGGQ